MLFSYELLLIRSVTELHQYFKRSIFDRIWRSQNGYSCTLLVSCVFGFVLETLPVGDIARACLLKRYACFKSVVYSDYGGRGDKSRVSDYC